MWASSTNGLQMQLSGIRHMSRLSSNHFRFHAGGISPCNSPAGTTRLEENQSEAPRILVCTGDVMGDIHAANLVRGILALSDQQEIPVDILAVGGKRVEEAGAKLVGSTAKLSSIGLLEAVPLLIPGALVMIRAFNALKSSPPQTVVLIDYPVFNLFFGRILKQHFRCKLFYYIPPNDWLWTDSRTSGVVQISDTILATYPKEAEYFRQAGCQEVIDVGHPLSDDMSACPSQQEARRQMNLPCDQGAVYVALVPASRRQEMDLVWPVISQAAVLVAAELKRAQRSAHFLLPVANKEFLPRFRSDLGAAGLLEATTLWQGPARVALSAADVAITKSGSVTLELALLRVPQVVVYRVSLLTAWIARTLLGFQLPWVSLVNVVSDQQVVPEFVQEEADPRAVAERVVSLLAAVEAGEDAYEGWDLFPARPASSRVARRAAQLVLDSVRQPE